MLAARLGVSDWSGLPTARTGLGARLFVPLSSPNSGRWRKNQGPFLCHGEGTPGAKGCHACHHGNSCSWKPEVGGVKYRLPHTHAAWERRGLSGRLPTHLAMSLDPPLYKGGTIPQALTERETMRRTRGDWEEDWRGWGGDGEGDYHQCPPPFLHH